MYADVVGRETEIRTMTCFLESLNIEPGVLALEGEHGIGKSTLWRSCLAEARGRGFRVLMAQPAPAEAQYAFASLADLLANVDARVFDKLPGPQRRAVEDVLLRTKTSGVATDPHATGAALLSILQRLADEAPVLVALDDLQWVDRSSIQAIAFAVRRLTTRVGVLATLRTEGPGDACAPWLRLPTDCGAINIQVGPLSLGALHRLLDMHTGRSFPRPTMMRIHDASGGNPFYALELARAIQSGDQARLNAPLPRALAHLVRGRIEGLGADVRSALLAVAALAEPTVELVELATEAADGLAARLLLEEAEKGGVIAIDGHRVRFTHPLLATGVYSAAPAATRRDIHERLATIVAEPEEHARHLALAAVRADQQTLIALDDAAIRARSRGAPAAAAELLELAIGLGGTTLARRLRSAQHHFDAGDPTRARTILEAEVAVLPPGPDRAEALRLLAVVRLHDDNYLESAGYLKQALEEAGSDLRLRVRISIELLFVLVNLGRIPDALRVIPDLLCDAQRLGDPALLALALANSTIVRFVNGEGLDESTLQRALDLEDWNLPTQVMLRPTVINSVLLAWSGRIDQARDGLRSLRRLCIERGEESDLMFISFHTVIVECWRGNLADARLIADDTMQRALQLGTELPLAIALSTQANVAAYAGEVDEARRAGRQALTLFERGGCLAVTIWPKGTLGFLDLSLEDYEAAASRMGPLAVATSALGYGEPMVAPFAADASEALIMLGRLDEATTLVDQLERNGRRLDRAWALALGARCRSLLLAAEGDLDGALRMAERALVEHERLPMPVERARTLLVLGQVQRRRRRRRAAATAIREAIRVFDEVGTPRWAARARAELERVCVCPSPAVQLTPSEARVAELAAKGLTNREAAGVLFISPKTIEANLARVYHKLGIRSRAELGQRMGEATT